jgi:hypothetical protein
MQLTEWLRVFTVVIVPVIGGLFAFFRWLKYQRDAEERARYEQEKDRLTRLLDAQRPFLSRQLDLYNETALIVGKLLTEDPRSTAWAEYRKRFWALYWSELSVVEHREVEFHMKNFGDLLKPYTDLVRGPQNDATGKEIAAAQAELEGSSFRLAHAIRTGIENSWRANETRQMSIAPVALGT